MVSIITNHISGREGFLVEAYRSLQRQNALWEWIIQSDPDCQDIDFRDSRVLTFKNKERLSISEKRNRALLHSSGQYIATLDDDDILPPGSLSARLGPLELGVAQFSFGIHAYIDGPERPIPYSPGIVDGSEIIKEWQRRKRSNNRSVAPAPVGIIWLREILWSLGGWPALHRSGDTALLLRAASLYQGCFIPTVTYLVRDHPGRSSKRDYHPDNWQWIEEWLRHSL